MGTAGAARRAAVLLAAVLVLAGVAQAGGGVGGERDENRGGEAAAAQGAALWTLLPAFDERALAGMAWIRPTAGQALALDVAQMAAVLAAAPLEEEVGLARNSPWIIALPTPEGDFERFRIVESPLMEPELQARFPEIRTYLGQGLDRPGSTTRFDLTPQGFHAQVLYPVGRSGLGRGAYYIDPITRGDVVHYMSYYADALPHPPAWTCDVRDEPAHRPEPGPATRGVQVERRSLTIVVAASGEYTAAVSAPGNPNFTAAHSAIMTTINRVTHILELDKTYRLVLSNFTPSFIYTDSATDPFNGTTTAALIEEMQELMNDNVPNSAYNLGHLFDARLNAGLAAVRSVCLNGQKARAVSSRTNPTGDAFDVRLVAHEIGHQLGARHAFNSTQGTCAGNRTAEWAYEPGSGTTIMAYAGSCGSDALVSTAIPWYASPSIWDMGFVPCGAVVLTENRYPFVDYTPPPRAMPGQTPFRLFATASDPDFDALSYSWEQQDLGAARPLGPDTGANEPLVMVREPSASSERFIPHLPDILMQTESNGERLPIYPRSSQWRMVVRDNVAGAAGVAWSDVVHIEFVYSGFWGFRVESPPGGIEACAGELFVVQWDPQNSGLPPVNCSNVEITLSLDGGETFPFGLSNNSPNSGSAIVVLPAVPTTRARIKVAGVDNEFFSISPGDFTIVTGPPTITQQPVGASVCPGDYAALSVAVGGGVPRQIRWFKDGVHLPFAFNQTDVVFPEAVNADSGDYRVEVSNACGTVVSQTVRLQVGVTFDQVPQAVQADPCSTVQFTAAARGVGPLSYRWLKDGVPLVDDGRISGAATPTLTITGARYEDEGMYHFRAQDNCETRNTPAVPLTLPTPQWVRKSIDAGPVYRSQTSSAMAYDPGRGVSVLYGGSGFLDSGFTGSQSDTWEWDGIEWVRRFPATNPGGRHGHKMVFEPGRGAVLLYGGSVGGLGNSEVWQYDGVWTFLTASPGGPPGHPPRHGSVTLDTARGRVVALQGDSGGSGAPSNQTWELDPAALTWQQVYQGPGPNFANSTIAYDPGRGYAIGQYHSAVLGTFTWTYAGTAWTAVNTTTPAQLNPLLAYDPVRRRVTMFGHCRGCGQGTNSTDTFAFNGASWQHILPSFHPNQFDALIPMAMVFDTRRRAMLAAGSSYNGSFTPVPMQTWEYRYLDRVQVDRSPAAEVRHCSAAPVTLAVHAAGHGALTYQWRRDGVSLSNGPTPHGSVISGATGPTLTITAPRAADGGEYDVVITNACGGETIQPVTLAVCPADVNCDGLVNSGDITAFLTLWLASIQDGTLAGDFNGDGQVNSGDITAMLSAWLAAVQTGGC